MKLLNVNKLDITPSEIVSLKAFCNNYCKCIDTFKNKNGRITQLYNADDVANVLISRSRSQVNISKYRKKDLIYFALKVLEYEGYVKPRDRTKLTPKERIDEYFSLQNGKTVSN